MLRKQDSGSEDISVLLDQMRDGSEVAATKLWEFYLSRLLKVSKRKLSHFKSGMADEEDVAVTAFHSFVKRIRRGDYSRINNRDEAWRMLAVIAVRKSINLVRDANSKRRSHVNEILASENLDVCVDKSALQPDTVAMISESIEYLLGTLDSEELQEVAMLKVAGFTNLEIANRLGRSVATIERRLKLIRVTWEGEL